MPKNGKVIEDRLTNSGKKRVRVKKVGSLLRFACLPSHQLIGEASIICMENGTWSHDPPQCNFLLNTNFDQSQDFCAKEIFNQLVIN